MFLPSNDAKFRAIYESHHVAVQRYCARRLDPDRANDATAEVFVVTWRRIGAAPEPSLALPWLYGVARNIVRHFHRSQQRHLNLIERAQSMDPPRSPDPATQVVRREEEEQVAAAMEQLREADRELVRLRLWEGLEHSEIGDVLGLSAKAVGMRYLRALKRLARSFEGAEKRRVVASEGREP